MAKDTGSGEAVRLLKPFGIAVCPKGRVLVADITNRAVLVFDLDAETAARWTGSTQFPLSGPVGVALDKDGRLYVTDTYLAQVVVFDPSGQPVAAFGKDVLRRPEGIAVSPAGDRVYVGDMRLNQVLAFDLPTFALRHVIGGPSREDHLDPGRFDAPANVAVDGNGRIYVTDSWNCRLQVFGPDGAYLRTLQVQCPEASRRSRPYAVAIGADGRLLYVAEVEEGGLQIFDTDGKPFQFVSGSGTRTLSRPNLRRTGIAVDGEDRIYVVEQEQDEGRVQIYQQVPDRRRTPAGTVAGKSKP